MGSRITRSLPRFRRCPELAREFNLTARDVAILRQVRCHRLLRSHDVSRLVGGSHQQVLRRLQGLFHHGYLDRPRAQLNSFLTGGSQAMIYALGSKGRRRLAEQGDSPSRPVGRRLGHPHLEHTTEIAEFMVRLERAAHESSQIRVIAEHELASRLQLPEPFRWSVQVQGRQIGIQPDKVFALEMPDDEPPVLCLLEVDRGTMPVKRTGLGRSSFRRKLLAYVETWRRDIHRSRFGFDRVRVLTVTHGEARMRNLIEEARRLDSGRGLFLFTTREAVLASSPLECDWHSTRETAQKLLATEIGEDSRRPSTVLSPNY